MKKIIILCFALFATAAIAHTIDWYVDGQIYQTTSCESGDNITPPTPPAKYGYTFTEWVGYKQLEYLESTGTQYINTGVKSASSISFEIVADRPKSPAQGTSWFLCGSVLDTTNGHIRIFESNSASSTAYLAFSYGKASSSTILDYVGLSAFNKSRFVMQNGVLTFDNGAETITSTHAGLTFSSLNDIYLFAGGASRPSQITTTIYSAKFYDNGTIIRDFIPVIDKHGIACMYDKVSQTFFYNSGTGDFVAGPTLEGGE